MTGDSKQDVKYAVKNYTLSKLIFITWEHAVVAFKHNKEDKEDKEEIHNDQDNDNIISIDWIIFSAHWLITLSNFRVLLLRILAFYYFNFLIKK